MCSNLVHHLFNLKFEHGSDGTTTGSPIYRTHCAAYTCGYRGCRGCQMGRLQVQRTSQICPVLHNMFHALRVRITLTAACPEN